MTTRSTQLRVVPLWVVFRPAGDVPGEWLAHCLDLDVVTQGSSFAHAVEMAREAIEQVVVDDVAHGLDPFTRRAPQEFWDEMRTVVDDPNVRRGTRTQLEAEASNVHLAVAVFWLAHPSLASAREGGEPAVEVRPPSLMLQPAA